VTSDEKTCFGRKICRNLPMCRCILFASTEVVRRPRSDCPLHFHIRSIWQIRTQKSNASARCLLPTDMLERWPQVCCVKITFTVLPTNHFVSTTTNLMKCLINWNLLRIRVRLGNTQPHVLYPHYVDIVHFYQKPNTSTQKPYNSAKKPSISTNPYILAKEPWIYVIKPCTFTKEP